MTRKLQLFLIFFAGLFGGGLIATGIATLATRSGWHVGGETLILPLMVLLIYFGWSLGTESSDYYIKLSRKKAYRAGYTAALKQMQINDDGYQKIS
jgi:hypothetical protein